ncbi:sigma-70 family RNA polymerase sigma factor [Streptomyces scabiei]|uniref:sigma-70 family RNA polymerase sigma factor n=1 Tax=Streptomyces scabiei TaxID=1930 RepID=UPI0029BC2A60|nr:sigma-70 family RNA polymerase sigma factor [Streptomyces scabiei]MDX3173139.1 sigma-70 family RNA polymerase sigma factor [Streptomyces scabiei]
MRSQDARERTDVAVVMAARAGDRQAAERLVRDCLPLVYNIVGRALNGHGDVDDVVQETMMRVLDGLPGLERPDRFRSWLVAITVRQIRDRWRKGRPWLTAEPLEATTHEADPQADFADLVVLRLALSGQRREAVEATRWLEDEEREVLALWWMESAGELTRGELSAACGLAPQHAAVRVQRVKERLETARTVVRAVTASPRCTDLAAALAPWDGRPSGLWRKRLARHVRDCPHCLSNSSDLIPAERLLAGLALAPVPVGLAGLVLARMPGAETAGAAAGAGTHTAGTHTAGTHTAGGAISAAGGAKGAAWTIGTTAAKPAASAVAVSAAAVVTLAAAGVAWYTFTGAHEPAPRPSRSVDDHGDYVSGSGRFGALSPVNAASSAATRRAATFTFVPGLADPRCYSLRDAAGRYLRHYAFRVRLDADDGSALFRKDVTFCPRPGSTAGSVSLESYNYPGRYLRHRDDLQLWLDRSQNTAAYRASRSFVLVAPWA